MIQRMTLNRLCSGLQLCCTLILHLSVDRQDFWGEEIQFCPFYPSLTIYKFQQGFDCFSKLLILFGSCFSLCLFREKTHCSLLKFRVRRLATPSGCESLHNCINISTSAFLLLLTFFFEISSRILNKYFIERCFQVNLKVKVFLPIYVGILVRNAVVLNTLKLPSGSSANVPL